MSSNFAVMYLGNTAEMQMNTNSVESALPLGRAIVDDMQNNGLLTTTARYRLKRISLCAR